MAIIITGFVFAVFVIMTPSSLFFPTANAQVPNILFTKTLQIGVIGDEVKGLQEFLKKFPNIYPEGLVTGYFGPLTENAVKRYQIKESIEAVGIIGPITRARLNNLLIGGATGLISVPTDVTSTTGTPTAAAVGTNPSGVTGSTSATLGLPLNLKVPSLNIDAQVVYVGLTSDGAMDVPKGPNDVAWFNLGPHPGEKGSAVIAGHEGWKDGIPAVFDNLYKLQKGDKVYIRNDAGETITFVVRELRTYGENEDASNVFNSSDGRVHLNLITCQGIWNKAKKSYSNRLVVFTDKE